jgi:AbiV family abortive infection protein
MSENKYTSEGSNITLFMELKDQCFKNAEQWINDARLLLDRESFGHANALFRFAREEIAKAFMCWLVVEELLPTNAKVIQNMFTKHVRKNEVINAIYQSISLDLEFLEKWEEKDVFERYGTRSCHLMEEYRESAIYVDIDKDEQKVKTPLTIDKTETLSLYQRVEAVLEHVKTFIQNFTPSQREEIRKHLNSLDPKVWDMGIVQPLLPPKLLQTIRRSIKEL